MSNKTQLQTNNTNLDALITRVYTAKEVAASLPEAGGGGSSNTAQVSLKATLADIWYVGVNGLTKLSNSTETVEMIIPSICLVRSAGSLTTSITGHCESITAFNISYASHLAFYITGDASLEVMPVGSGGGAD